MDRLASWLAVGLIGGPFLAACTSAQTQAVRLRSEPKVLTEAEVRQVIRARGFAYPGEGTAGSFVQQYEPAVLQGASIVNEHVSGLMWQQAETPRVDWRELQAYVEEANRTALAGFSDWRIPTVEELASLLESRQSGENYLDEVFTKDDLLGTWTSDEAPDGVGGAWFVSFTDGKVWVGNRLAGLGHGRLVRTFEERERRGP